MDEARRAELIERYREGPDVLEQAVAGASDQELDVRPEGEWSAREVVHHMADSEMTSAIRLRRLLAEDDPTIVGYDGEKFARRLHYDTRPIGPSLSAVRGARETTAQILDRLSPQDWERSGTHTESGPYSVERWLQIYSVHAHEHADQILRTLGREPEDRPLPPPA